MRKNKFNKMKIVGLLSLSLLLLLSCSDKDELGKLKSEKSELEAEKKKLEGKIKDLNKKIAVLDTIKEDLSGITRVKALALKDTSFTSYFESMGVVESKDEVLVSPETSGIVKRIFVREGQRIGKGATIAELDASVIRNNIAQVEKSLELATQLFEKQQKLWDQNIGTEVQYLQAKNNKESLEKNIATLNSQLSLSIIKSPISGTVDEIYPKLGEMASPAQMFARVVSRNQSYVSCDVSEAYIGKIKAGDKVSIRFPNQGDESVEGKVAFTANYINPSNRTFKVNVSPNRIPSFFIPNLLTVVQFEDFSQESAVVIPSSSVLDDGQTKYVFVLVKEEGKAIVKKKKIVLGPSSEGSSLVMEGLSVDDELVVKGQTYVVDGERVLMGTK